MAIGLGLMLGFTFPKNFDSPYLARSITDFWRRWHVSLSTWLRDYLYMPLGGNRRGPGRTYVNLMLVMLLGGLWHGADWKFLVWGAIHGGWLAFERALGKDSAWRRLPAAMQVAITFGVVLVAWVFFRADSVAQAFAYVGCMFGGGGADAAATALNLGATLFDPQLMSAFVVAAAIAFAAPQSWDWTRRLTLPRVALCMLLLVAALLAMEHQPYNPFIYFIF
jgi:alginate O-acetyltransferase complex protein AlgI